DIADLNVTTDKLADGSVTTAKLSDDAVTSAKIASGAVTTDEISDGTIISEDIKEGEVKTADIADASVTALKLTAGAGAADRVAIADGTGAVTYGSVPSTSVTGKDLTSTDLAVTGGTGATLTAVTLGIAAGAVTTVKIADANVTTSKLADGSVTNVKLGPDAVTSDKIYDGTIINSDISATAAISDSKLATISTTGKVDNSATTATSANTANTIVLRDASNNFSAGIITANLNGNAATVTTNANLTGPITSVGNVTSVASQTGTGSKFVMDNSPVLITPTLGAATATSINGNTITTGTGILTIAAGKTLEATDNATVSGTNTGDNAVNSLYSGLVTNATHTGDATGATAITVVGINGTSLAGLSTGILKNTTATGVPTIAVAGTDYVSPNASITGSTRTKITYDSKGLVTSGADATTADIPSSSDRRYVTDAQLTVIGNTSGTNTGDNAVNSLYSGLVTNATHTGDATGATAITVVGINGTSLAGLSTGILKNTTATGVPTIAVAGTDYVSPNASITGSTRTKITYDSKGLVTSGADATTADIPSSSDRRYVTDAQLTVIGNTSGTNTGDNAVNSLYSGLVTNATHTGEVTGSDVLTITDNSVTNLKLATVSTAIIKGRVSAGPGNVEDLTATQVRTLLNVADGANNYTHPTGDGNLHVIATSTTNNGKVLTAGATPGSLSWTTPANGTVTSVTGTANRIIIGGTAKDPVVDIAGTYTGQNTITTLGTVTTGTWHAGIISPEYGGTGKNNGTNTITLGGTLTTATDNITLTAASGGSNVALPSSGTLVTLGGTETLTNKTIAAGSNMITGLTNGNLSGTAGITNANLANSSIKLGTTAISLGATEDELAGLTSVTSANFVGDLTGDVTGNAATATKLETPRNINGVAFDGTSDITISAATNIIGGTLGAIPYQTAPNVTGVLAATSTANRVLLSGASAAPSWSTTTYPVSTTINQLLYSSAANTVSGIATASNGVLTTDASGVPSITPKIIESNLPAGTIVLLHADEGLVSGNSDSYDAISWDVPANTYSLIMIEAEITLTQSGANDANWSFEVFYDGSSKKTIPLRAKGNNGNDSHRIGAVLKYSEAFTSGGPISIDVTAFPANGMWYIRGFRIYGVI
ncbi:MAG TPA: hypothetical protein PLR88_03445, partial [Bacteroidales bacterium]|nr:hypothetical protein [Bacteroidales bacterium]